MKQIFDWLREQIVHTANDVSPNTDKLLVLYGVEKLINEAEAKWGKELVSVETYKQVAWERDIAIEQLHELGYEFGEKVRECAWKLEDAEANLYVTKCEQRQLIFEGTPKEHGYKHCPYCGRKIVEVE